MVRTRVHKFTDTHFCHSTKRTSGVIVNLKLTNLDKVTTSHFIGYDGKVIQDQDLACEVHPEDRQSPKQSKKVFRELYGKKKGFASYEIVRVWELVTPTLCEVMNKLSL